MLVTDSKFNVSKERKDEKKASIWSHVKLSLASVFEKISDKKEEQLEQGLWFQ